MGPFDGMGDMSGMMGMLQGAMQQFKEKSAAARCEGTAGGGLVKVVVTGDNEVVSVEIGEAAMDDRELLEDLVRAATSEALRKVKAEIAANIAGMTGGLPIPPGLLPF
jgi:hypothetical protein